jgi:hypothetical protein
MKFRFIDARNCYALLPPVRGLPMARILDDYLRRHINDKQGELHGAVRDLIKHNESTIKRARSSNRLCDSAIEIALIYNSSSREVDVRGIKKPLIGPANFHTLIQFANGITWKTIVPLQYLLKGWGDANRGNQCYVHSISHNVSQVQSFADMQARGETTSDDFHYVGITGRNWLHRFREHMGEMERGSGRRFYRAWRESMGMTDVHFISQLGEINLTFSDAMNWEEVHVDRLGANGLNMIPGGFKGLRLLHELRITNGTDISLEDRDLAIAEYARQNPRKGVPNPFIAELWKDDEYYLKVIGARQKTLMPSQVRKIREYNKMGWSVERIAEAVGALNEIQVKNVISGKTYRRIH